MKYLEGEEILFIHSEIIDNTGGAHGVRDPHLFASIMEKPKSTFGEKELYEGVFSKAATYFEGFAKFHVFIDGNKRTAIASSARFLTLNSYELRATNEDLESFALKVISDKLDLSAIAAWLKKNSKKI